MTKRRKPAVIMRDIIRALRGGPLSFRALETKVNTDDKTISNYVQILQQFRAVRVKTHRNGKRRFRTAELTSFGRMVKL